MESSLNENNITQVQKTRSRKVTFIISITLMIIVTVLKVLSYVLTHPAKNTDSAAYGFGKITGVILGMVIIVAVVVFLIFRFKSINLRANLILIFSILFFLSQISTIVNSANIATKERKQEKATQEMLTQIVKSTFSNVKTEKQNFSEEKYGINARMLTITSEFLNNMLDEKVKFQAKLSSFNLNTYLGKEALSSKENINKSIDKMAELKDIINNYQLSYEKSLKDMGASISELKVPESYKNSALSGFNDSINKNKSRNEDYFKIENEIFNNYTNILKFLKDSFGNFEVENDACNFFEQKDADKFNELAEILNVSVDKENVWIKDNEQMMKDLIKKNEKLTQN
jgi:hypothetical protein